jgi:hypothetical protein
MQQSSPANCDWIEGFSVFNSLLGSEEVDVLMIRTARTEIFEKQTQELPRERSSVGQCRRPL